MGYIYKINFPNSKCYIGQTKNSVKERLKQHLRQSRCTAVYGALKKYKNNYNVETLVEVNDEELDEYEIYYINLYNSISPGGYNLKGGGKKGFFLSDESKKKMSEIRTGASPYRFKQCIKRPLRKLQESNRKFEEESLGKITGSKVSRFTIERLESIISTYKKRYIKLNTDDNSIIEYDNKMVDLISCFNECIIDDPSIDNFRFVLDKQLNVYRKNKFEHIKLRIENLFEEIRNINYLKTIVIQKKVKNEKKQLIKKESSRKEAIVSVLKEHIRIEDKFYKLKHVLTDEESTRFRHCIEDIADNDKLMLSCNKEDIDLGIQQKWRTLSYKKSSYLRVVLCSKLIHTMWRTADFFTSMKTIKNGRMLEYDGEGIFNYKRGTFTFKGILYELFPEMPDIIDKAFSIECTLYDSWKDFDNLFNIYMLKCSKQDDCNDNLRICSKHKHMFKGICDLYVRHYMYFPTYNYLVRGNMNFYKQK